MTKQVTLSLGSVTVDFTNLNVKVTHRISNPFITVDTPRVNLLESNTIVVNIGFVTEAIDLTFILTDGIGTLNWAQPTTNYEKLFYMAYQGNPKVLMLDDRLIYCQIENLNLPWEPGQKDLSIGGILSLRVCMNIAMQTDAGQFSQPITFNSGSVWINCANSTTLFQINDLVFFESTDTLPSNILPDADYFVVGKNDAGFQISLDQDGEPITISGTGTGTITVTID
jgi:hypothetical protein